MLPSRAELISVPMYANVFLLTSPQGRLLVDTGTVVHAPRFLRLLRSFRPDALLVTHAHPDHAGSAFLAGRAGLSVLAHPLEHPALLGEVHDLPYPAGRPGVGRLVSRAHPNVRASALRAALPGQDVLGWEVVHLPGHTAGQIGLRRGGVLIAADAVVGSADGAHLPRAAYNHDHAQALATLKTVAGMDLREIWPGHGGVLTAAQVQARAARDGG
ncbi:MBL fold metallo-hydrolase [Deinococcus seoulensis]|uniref:MBL fold metallo-hydrolase n=1 Tax=Deinococcus seoulensis TaxID=1837379 RepID=UPI0027E4F4CF|nr:MBL fold metallo-hydrolase [Deinococcus seoulensis]